MDTALVTDSSARLTLDPSPFVRIVPIRLHFVDEAADIAVKTSERVYRALLDGEEVKSSAPSPLDYLEAIEATDARHVFVLTPAAEFTAMYRHACLAATLTDRSVAVMDSRTAAAAQGLVALEAWRACMSGATLHEVEAVARAASRRAELVAKLDTLDYLLRSGRVSSVDLQRAQKLGIRPVFRLKDGGVHLVATPQSVEAALRRIAREWTAGGGAASDPSVAFHAVRPEEVAWLAAGLDGRVEVAEFSPAMGLHTGPGVVGAAWLRPEGWCIDH